MTYLGARELRDPGVRTTPEAENRGPASVPRSRERDLPGLGCGSKNVLPTSGANGVTEVNLPSAC